MTKLEIYGVLLLVLGLALGGSYAKGRYDEAGSIHKSELAADAQALDKANAALQARAAADDAARGRTLDFLNAVNGGLQRVQDQFGKLPQVVVDAHGCADLSGNFGLRWNAAAWSLPGAPRPGAGDAHAGLPADPLPAPGGPR